MEERLLQMGSWLAANGEAIYATKPWTAQNDTITPNVYYTQSATNSDVFAIIQEWPQDHVLTLGALKLPSSANLTLIATKQQLKYEVDQEGQTVIHLDQWPRGHYWAWAIKISTGGAL
jgi:alpha-L-fucosidase